MKTFTYTFEQGRRDRIEFEYDDLLSEKLRYDDLLSEKLRVEDLGTETPARILNRSGMLTLAKLLIKMALGDYSDTFHLHLNSDFDGDQDEVIIVALTRDDPREEPI